MNFYIDPAFYVFLAVAIVPAAILGFSGRRIKYYGLAASLAFLLLLFGENLEGSLLSLRSSPLPVRLRSGSFPVGGRGKRRFGSTGWHSRPLLPL